MKDCPCRKIYLEKITSKYHNCPPQPMIIVILHVIQKQSHLPNETKQGNPRGNRSNAQRPSFCLPALPKNYVSLDQIPHVQNTQVNTKTVSRGNRKCAINDSGRKSPDLKAASTIVSCMKNWPNSGASPEQQRVQKSLTGSCFSRECNHFDLFNQQATMAKSALRCEERFESSGICHFADPAHDASKEPNADCFPNAKIRNSLGESFPRYQSHKHPTSRCGYTNSDVHLEHPPKSVS
jgi:hypothetical protein